MLKRFWQNWVRGAPAKRGEQGVVEQRGVRGTLLIKRQIHVGDTRSGGRKGLAKEVTTTGALGASKGGEKQLRQVSWGKITRGLKPKKRRMGRKKKDKSRERTLGGRGGDNQVRPGPEP